MTSSPSIAAASLADLADRINAEHQAVCGGARTTLQHAINAGDLLIEAKAKLSQHGRWLSWLDQHCPNISERTAQNYMRLARNAPNVTEANPQSIADLSISAAIDQLSQPATPRNHVRAMNHRRVKLGEDTIAKIKGTALDTAREKDALIFLNRGAPEGGHTPEVTQLVAAAAAGEDVSAIAYTKSGAAYRRDDPASTTEIERIRARNDELERENRRLERENIALKSEIEELKARLSDVPEFLRREPAS